MPSIMNSLKQGLGLGLGFHLSVIVFMILGFLFFLPGYILYTKEVKSGKKSSTMAVVGVVLMGIGVIIMGGFGFGMLLDGINQIS